MKKILYITLLSLVIISLSSCSEEELNDKLDNTVWAARTSIGSPTTDGLIFKDGYLHKVRFSTQSSGFVESKIFSAPYQFNNRTGEIICIVKRGGSDTKFEFLYKEGVIKGNNKTYYPR